MTAARSAAASRWYLAAGVGVVAVGPLLGSLLNQVAYAVLGLSVLVAIGIGVRRYRPEWSLPWWLLFASVAAGLLASASWAAELWWYGERRFPSVGDGFYAVVLPLLMLSVAGWVRRGSRHGGFVEAGVIALGGATLSWAFVVEPLLHGAHVGGSLAAAYLFYAACDVGLLVLAVRVVLISRVRTPAYRLLVGAAAAMITTDTLYYALTAAGNQDVNRITAVGYLSTYLLAGAAALHPSMARSTGRVSPNLTLTSRSRLVSYLLLIVLTGAITVYALRDRHSLLHMAVPVTLGCVMSVLLVVRLYQLGALIQKRNQFDGLTGLGNRALLKELLHRSGPRSRALLLIDLDGFRDVNDNFGHPAGDAVLVEAATRLRHAVPAATVLRLGADEFAVLLDNAGEADAVLAGEHLLTHLRTPYPVPSGGTAAVTASIGAVALGADPSADQALRDADLALYAARNAGGNQVAVYDADLHAERLARTRLIADLHTAAAERQFTVHYQPIVDLVTGGIVAAEALLRWTKPDGTSVPPNAFIPLAEHSGVIVAVGDWVLGQVCADLREWWPRHGLAVTVNVSARQLRDSSFAASVRAHLAANDLPGEALILEITETVLITSVVDTATVAAQLELLREKGVRIAIDDFGTGYSSLSYLRHLPVDILKMDGSFTRQQIDSGGARDLAFIRTILDLSATLGLRTVAEAVETAEQAQRLRDLGCDLAQGYHFARPGPAAALADLLARRGRQPTGQATRVW